MPNRSQISQVIAHALDDLLSLTATGGSTTTVILPQLITLAANPATSLENGAWLYNATKAFQARGQSAGYTASSGTVKVEPAWAAPTNGDTILITRLFPMATQVLSRDSGYDFIANEAARWLWFEYQIPLTTVAGQAAYAQSASGRWLVSRDQLIADERGGPIIDPPIVTGYVPPDGTWRRPMLDFVAGVPILRLASPYDSSGETFYLRVKCPVLEVINGVDTVATMIQDGDSVNCEMGEIEAVGLWIAARTLAMGQGPDAAAWAKMAADYEARARSLKHFYSRALPTPPAAAAPPATAAA